MLHGQLACEECFFPPEPFRAKWLCTRLLILCYTHVISITRMGGSTLNMIFEYEVGERPERESLST